MPPGHFPGGVFLSGRQNSGTLPVCLRPHRLQSARWAEIVVRVSPSCTSSADRNASASSSSCSASATAVVFTAVVNASGSHPQLPIPSPDSSYASRLPHVLPFFASMGKTVSFSPPSHNASSTALSSRKPWAVSLRCTHSSAFPAFCTFSRMSRPSITKGICT